MRTSLLRTPAGAAVVALALVGVGCSGGDGGEPATPRPVQPITAGASRPAAPQPSPTAALTALLDAETAGDHAASYRLLTTDARKELTAAAWTRRRNEVPAVTGFTVEGVKGTTVVALVDHDPGLDPFVGLRPAQDRQRWTAREEADGWLLQPDPRIETIYPPAGGAPPAALDWAKAVQRCDGDGVLGLQAVDVLFGTSDAPARLCRTAAQLTAGAAERLPAGPASQDLVGQYGADVLTWARAVRIAGGERPFHAVLAPIGSVWRVVGVFEP